MTQFSNIRNMARMDMLLFTPHCNILEPFQFKEVISLERSNTVLLTQKVHFPAYRAQTRRVRFCDPTRVKAIESGGSSRATNFNSLAESQKQLGLLLERS